MTDRTIHVDATHALASEPARLPIRALLAIGVEPGDPDVHPFNLPAWIAHLLRYSRGQGRVVDPRVWSTWDMAILEAFLRDPPEVPEWMDGLPGSPPDPVGIPPLVDPGRFVAHAQRRHRPVDVLHAAFRVGGPVPVSDLPGFDPRRVRLLVLQVPPDQVVESEPQAIRFVERGGPAVLLVAGPRAVTDLLLAELYATIAHGQPLTAIAAAPPWMEKAGLVHRLVIGEGGADLLRFGPWLERVRDRARVASDRVRGLDPDSLKRYADRYLHAADRRRIQDRFRTMEQAPDLAGRLRDHANRLDDMLGWDPREGNTARMEEIAREASRAEREATAALEESRQLEAELEAHAARAPRVLNANFRAAGETSPNRVLAPDEGLVGGDAYDLLVDVGPRWDGIPSLVRGKSAFPENAIADDPAGYRVRVILASDDFRPKVVSAEMWVPRTTGRSHPVTDGEPADRAGPVALRVRAPETPRGSAEPTVARARLTLCHENNVLQSAAIRVGVVGEPGDPVEEPNAVDVDYVLSGTLQDVEARYSARRLRLYRGRGEAELVYAGGEPAESEEEMFEEEHLPVGLSLALNDDGAGSHKILAILRDGGEAAPEAWLDYDADAARRSLQGARDALIECFFWRDRQGKPHPKRTGLDPRNGRTKDQFLMDLDRLARLGRQLRAKVLAQIVSERGPAWVTKAHDTLQDPCVVQIARTRKAGYAFPWALLYEHPLPGATTGGSLRVCDVLKAWGKSGDLAGDRGKGVCPNRDEPWHREDVLCPYGFWGLRHVIEQPVSPMWRKDGRAEMIDVPDAIPVGAKAVLSVGVTRDRRLPGLDRLDDWLEDVCVPRFELRGHPTDNPATSAEGVRALLPDAAIAFFLCHGRRDESKDEPFLGLGENRDPEPAANRIYPSALSDWADPAAAPNLATWSERRPFVFINGCETAALEPGEVLNFVDAFGDIGAGGVLGTEVSVTLPLALEVAGEVLESLDSGASVGEAIYRIRWRLVEKGNLLGLAYTPYCLASLRLVRS